jgi:hypothetical protein
MKKRNRRRKRSTSLPKARFRMEMRKEIMRSRRIWAVV